MRLLGAVVAGGRSLRFGSDKALATLHGRPLIEHAVAALAAQTESVIVCGKAWGHWVADRPEPNLGPLGGIAAALHHAQSHCYDAVLTSGCDVPLLPGDLLQRLTACGDAAFVVEMPLIGLWPASLAPRIDAHLAAGGERSVRGWARVAGAQPLMLGIPIANVNRPEDLAALDA